MAGARGAEFLGERSASIQAAEGGRWDGEGDGKLIKSWDFDGILIDFDGF